MGNNEIREPVQKRSIEKKEKIIEAGFKLICEKGYYNTNTAEIAKAAGVSTGIVYNYFQDKHDIFIDGIKKYAISIFYPMFSIAKSEIEFDKKDLNKVLKKMIDNFIENHKLSQVAHEEITAMTHSDKEVANIFKKAELDMTSMITSILVKNNFNTENLAEKVHISVGIIDNLCHEVVYHKHSSLDYQKMTDLVIDTISKILL